MSRVFFDLESDGLLDTMTKIHCIELYNDTNEFYNKSLEDKAAYISEASEIVGHNIVCFDIPAITKIYPWFKPRGKVIDTLLLSRMLYPEVETLDIIKGMKDKEFFNKMKEHKLIGKHSLKAWGFRLGFYKGTFGETTDWKICTPEMIEYCKQDVLLTKKLYEFFIVNNKISWEAYDLEYQFQLYIIDQQDHGCYFDKSKALFLKQKLTKELDDIKTEIKRNVPDWVETTIFEPKKCNKVKGYVVGQTYERRKTIEFNPNSRMQIEKFLKQKYSWEPSTLTKTGRAKIDSDILEDLETLDWIEAKYFNKFLTITKLLGYISEGNNAWLKLVKDGKIHGQLITNGAITRRCTHFKPNLGQVPSVKKYLGKECRQLFYAPNGYKFIGGDASGIELRCFAHYLYPYDNGSYASTILDGDIHTRNQKDAGLPTRDNAKTFIYGMLYGAGNAKIGLITNPHSPLEVRKQIGAQLKNNFILANPAYGRLLNDLKKALKFRGYVVGLDNHILKPRQEHSSLNTLLQNCAAVLMKRATIIFRDELISRGLWMTKVFPCLHVHDEWQVIGTTDISEEVGKLIPESIRKAGEYYKLRIRLDGEYKIGDNWMETH